MHRTVLILAFLAFAPLAHGRAFAPRVVSEHNADAYSMKTFRQFHRWRNLKGDKLAWEIFQYLTDKRTGLYPMGAGAWEGTETMYDYKLIRDPVKMINVYSLGYCDVLGPTMAGIWKDAGLGRSRTVNLPDWGHVLAEVEYDGKWHYLDLDVRAAFHRSDGSLASMAEAKRDGSLWQGPRGPRFFPMDNLAHVRKVYGKTPVRHRHGVNMGGHTMDFILRRGETFTRWWTPQGGRWNHNASYNKGHKRRIIESEPRGPKAKHRSFTVHTSGNGRFVYRPDLTSRSADFADGAYDAENVRPGASGLTLVKAGKGYAVFEIRSPYVIVPVVGKLDTTEDDREASVVDIDAQGASLAVSVDGGITWQALETASRPATIDLTPHASGRYSYLLKIALDGRPGQALVRSLKVTTWVQLHPAALPSLRRGSNRMEYRTGDHYGLQTRVLEIRPFANDREAFLKHMHTPPKTYDPNNKTGRIRGPFVVKVPAPPGTRIAWFSAGGNFRTHQHRGARNTRNTMAYAVGAPAGFKEFYRASVPADNDHWHYNADVEVKLKEPAKTVYIQYVGDPGVNNIRIYAHCVEERKVSAAPITITHVWTENGASRKKTVTMDKPGAYTVQTGGDPKNVSIELAIASSRAKRSGRGLRVRRRY